MTVPGRQTTILGLSRSRRSKKQTGQFGAGNRDPCASDAKGRDSAGAWRALPIQRQFNSDSSPAKTWSERQRLVGFAAELTV